MLGFLARLGHNVLLIAMGLVTVAFIVQAV
jgi:hypothetical protein